MVFCKYVIREMVQKTCVICGLNENRPVFRDRDPPFTTLHLLLVKCPLVYNYVSKISQFQTTTRDVTSTDNSLDFDDFRSGCQNISQCHHNQSFSGLHSPGRSDFTDS